MTIPTLHTERLTLRAPQMGDFEAFAAFFATDRSSFVGGPLPRNGAWRAFASNVGQWHLKGFGTFAAEETETGRYIGNIGCWYPEGWIAPEIAWIIVDPAAEGRGFAYEAALAARAWAYGTLGWTEVFSVIDHGNHRSAALARRLGCTVDRDGTFEDGTAYHLFRHPAPEAPA